MSVAISNAFAARDPFSKVRVVGSDHENVYDRGTYPSWENIKGVKVQKLKAVRSEPTQLGESQRWKHVSFAALHVEGAAIESLWGGGEACTRRHGSVIR